ncbi:acetate--CoA ligase family protein [Micromonospora sp. 4G57]|uniref:Acetate--CoA ligase family protein n=1 Tax=Micromonospora sicca TaxID=2202420 RepID=A0ABU5JE05_9ACTN|nr:acetate--CoA ligase family protein [Micromonospora sp. 4G53]MDZ5445052.1 acetate--CoA ligase family protein [Micromonospora sp. 4G57]MDZ5490828.1 acetate--CoA ligase family protein [Micromonospora sp. 4G53]
MAEFSPPRTGAVDALLHPSSIAIVGASERPGGWPQRIRDNLRRFGYAGVVHPVNPNREIVWGDICYASPSDLPEPADHLIVLIPAKHAVEAVRQGARAGSRSATVFSSGLDADQLAELRAIADETGMAISGPNCLGNISAVARMVTTTDSRLDKIKDGPVAVVGQSGGVVTALHRALVSRGVGVRYMVSSGNETALTTADYIRYFAADDQVRVVAAFVESVRDRDAFFAACDELAARGKRLVALKVGRSEASRLAAASHTGALAGSFAAFTAVAAAHGVVVVPSLDVAVEACELLSRVPAPSGGSVGVVAVSGGVRELALDSAALHGVELASLAEATQERISKIIGPDMEVSNPLDSGYAGLSDPANLVACVEAMADDPAVGMVLLQEELLGVRAPHKERALRLFDDSFPGGRTVGAQVPVALFSMTSTNVTEIGREIRDSLPNLAFVQGIDNAVAIAGALLSVRPHLTAPGGPASATTSATADPARSLLRELPEVLTEADAKRLLALYGVTAPEEAVVASPEEAAAWASGHGPGPFVVKVVASGLHHKSESGGVRLGLVDPEAVASAAAEVVAKHPGLDGLLVAKQVVGGIELIVGFQNDREVGPVVAVGLGGTAVELYGDLSLLPARCTPQEARAALDKTAAGPVLAGWRGAAGGDVDAAVDVICAMAQLAGDLGDELESVEINPLVVLPPGQGAMALDALCLGLPREAAS